MYLDHFFSAAENVFRRIREEQRNAIEAAAEAIAKSLSAHGALVVMDTGHMLRHEAMVRAGGLMAIAPFAYDLTVENDMPQRTATHTPEEMADIEARKAALALDASNMRPGDVLIINSNSGRTPNVIETALQCKPRGIVTIGLSSAGQMAQCAAAHHSGKKLFDVVDLPVDNCGPYGDAVVEVKDNEKMCPLSGLASAYVFWAIQAEAVERLQALGVNPTIYRSVHVSGQEYIDTQRERFIENGI